MISREQIIVEYINGYNNFDIERMLKNLDENLRFENISNGVSNMTLQGLAAFKEQAEKAKSLFTTRTQTIKSFRHQHELTEIEIEYNAVLAVDLPNGLKKGEVLNLRGKSIFKFYGKKIIELIDIS